MLALVASLLLTQCPSDGEIGAAARQVEVAQADLEAARHQPGYMPGSLVADRKLEAARLARESLTVLRVARDRCLADRARAERAEQARLAAVGQGTSRLELEARADEAVLAKRCPTRDEVALRRRRAEPLSLTTTDAVQRERAEGAWAAVRRAEAARDRCGAEWERKAALDPKELQVKLSVARCDAQGVLAGRPGLGAPPKPRGAPEPPGSTSAEDALYEARSVLKAIDADLEKAQARPLACAAEPVKTVVACLGAPTGAACRAEPTEWRLRLYRKDRRPGGGRAR